MDSDKLEACKHKHHARMEAQNEKHTATLRTIDGYRISSHDDATTESILALARKGAQVEHATIVARIQDAMVREAGRIALGWGIP